MPADGLRERAVAARWLLGVGAVGLAAAGLFVGSSGKDGRTTSPVSATPVGTTAHAGHDGNIASDSPPAVDPIAPGQTELQKARAQSLIDDMAILSTVLTDPTAALSRGYRSVGKDGDIERFINDTYLTDLARLDPIRPEGLVFRGVGNNVELIAVQFVSPPGDPIPDAVGPPTLWLTTSPQEPTAPTLTVWLVPNSCGRLAPIGPC